MLRSKRHAPESMARSSPWCPRRFASWPTKAKSRLNASTCSSRTSTTRPMQRSWPRKKGPKRSKSHLTQQTVEVFTGLAASMVSVFEGAQQTSLNVKQQVATVRQVVETMNNLNHGAMETTIGIAQTKGVIAHLREIAQTLR